MENKRGQNLSLTTIILVAIGIVVLVILIWGFSSGWGNLWSKATSYFGGGNNVDTIIQSCALACTTESEHDFCTLKRSVKIDAGVEAKGTCYQLSENDPGVENSAQVSVTKCSTLAAKPTCETVKKLAELEATQGTDAEQQQEVVKACIPTSRLVDDANTIAKCKVLDEDDCRAEADCIYG